MEGQDSFPTGWEAFLKGKYATAPSKAMEISNLCGLRTAATPTIAPADGTGSPALPVVQGVCAFIWSQAPQPSGEGLTIDISGFGDTLSISVGMRAYRFSTSEQDALQHFFAPCFKQVLSCLLACGPNSEQDTLTVGKLARESWSSIFRLD